MLSSVALLSKGRDMFGRVTYRLGEVWHRFVDQCIGKVGPGDA